MEAFTIRHARELTGPLASPEPVPTICPRCGAEGDPWINPFFTAIAGGEVRYGTTVLCSPCDVALQNGAPMKIDPLHLARTTRERLQRARIPPTMLDWSLESYPRRGSALARAEEWLREPASDVLLYGNPGTGKTGLAIAMLRECILRRRLSGMFLSATDLLSLLRSTWRRDAPESEGELWQRISSVQVLLLDDVGVLRATDFFEETFHTLVNARRLGGCPTLITMNYDPDEIATAFSTVTFDRLQESARLWRFGGDSIRQRGGLQYPVPTSNQGDHA